MQKRIALLLSIIMILTILASCGVTQSDYDVLVAERDTLQINNLDLQNEFHSLQAGFDTLNVELESLQIDYNDLMAEYEKLVIDTADWLKLSEEDRQAFAASVEAERLKAEEEARLAAEEEEKKGYDTGITFDQLARYPDDYENKKVQFTGKVLQVSEVSNEIQIRLAVKKTSYGWSGDETIYLFFSNSLVSGRLLEDDVITIYGTAKGLHTYTTVMGASVTLPLIRADKIDQ